MGMTTLLDKNVVNSIEMVADGPHAGKLKVNVSTSPVASRSYYTHVNEIYSMLSVGDDDLGKTDVENNIVCLKTATDESGAEVENEQFLLPADAVRDA